MTIALLSSVRVTKLHLGVGVGVEAIGQPGGVVGAVGGQATGVKCIAGGGANGQGGVELLGKGECHVVGDGPEWGQEEAGAQAEQALGPAAHVGEGPALTAAVAGVEDKAGTCIIEMGLDGTARKVMGRQILAAI